MITVSALADFDGAPGGFGSPTCRTDEDDTGANFSNWGETIEVATPGVCILSTWKDGGTNTISGTSMASPHVAGAAALLASGANNDPTSKADVEAIIATIINEGNGDWTDDSGDGIQEPLLDVVGDANVFEPVTLPGDGGATPTNYAPVVSLTSPTDGATFDSGAEIFFEGTASDTEDGDLTASLDWTSNLVNGTIGSGGSFFTTLSDGTHTVTASVTDLDGATGSDSISVTVGALAGGATTASVVDPIECSLYGGKTRNKHLDIAVTVLDNQLDPVQGAIVSVEITFNSDGPFWSPTATTASDGTVVFAVKNAAAGDYVTSVFNVDAPPLTWDKIQPTNNTCSK